MLAETWEVAGLGTDEGSEAGGIYWCGGVGVLRSSSQAGI